MGILQRTKKPLALVIIGSVFVYLFGQVASNREVLERVCTSENATFLFIHFLTLFSMQWRMLAGWKYLLRVHGIALPFRNLIYSYLLPNFGKYLPGKVLFFAGRVELTHRLSGKSRTIAINLLLLETFFLVGSAALLTHHFFFEFYEIESSFRLLLSGLLFLVILFLIFWPRTLEYPVNRVLAVFSQPKISLKLFPRDMLDLIFNYSFIWILYGLSGVALVCCLSPLSFSESVYVASAFILSWLVGFLSVITPGGLGVREAILVLSLQNMIGSANAVVLALLARLSWSAIELAISGLTFFLGTTKEEKISLETCE